MDMFSASSDTAREKALNKEKAIDKLRQKYGGTAVVRASYIENDIGIIADDVTDDDE